MNKPPALPRLRTQGSTFSDPELFQKYLELRRHERERRKAIAALRCIAVGLVQGLVIGYVLGRLTP